MKMTRRQFLGTAIATTAVAACGGDDGGGVDAMGGRNCQANGTSATISGNHGHTITVTAAQIAAGADMEYTLEGTAGHMHTVTITGANFATLQSNPNGSIMVTSSTTNAHMHSVTVLCA